MSRHASLAFANLEFANVALEDILLAEMAGHKGTTLEMRNYLMSSSVELGSLISTMDALRKEMHVNGYRDILTEETPDLNLYHIGARLSMAGMVNATAWDKVQRNARGGFEVNLKMLRGMAVAIQKGTIALLATVESLEASANKGILTLALEENLDNNLKPDFARLYTFWNTFQAHFLASALLSTEVHYYLNDHGSLVDQQAQMAVAS